MNNLKNCIILLVFLCLTVTGCGRNQQIIGGAGKEGYPLNETASPNESSAHVESSIANVLHAGTKDPLAFLARDEKEPLRQVFCFSEIGLFYVDQNQKQTEIDYQNNSGKPIQWTDMPVIAPYSGTAFFSYFENIMDTRIGVGFRAQGKMPNPAGFEEISIVSEEPMDSIYSNVPATLVRALLTSNGRTAEGIFVVIAVGDGFGHATALLVTGISAPTGEFSRVQDQLQEVVRSWTLDEAYVQDGLRMK